MSEQESALWNRRPDEPDAAYVRFLIYRNLGPVRSLEAAYRKFMEDLGEIDAAKSCESLPVSGQWFKDSRSFDWVRRARAWDIAVFSEVGREAVIALGHYTRALAIKGLEALANSSGPENWKAHLETLHALCTIIPPEIISALLQQGATRPGDSEPKRPTARLEPSGETLRQ
jgi:hypothetical protein